MTIERTTSGARAPLSVAHGPVLRQIRPTLWRVLRADGSMAGYIEHTGPTRFEARRLAASTRQVSSIGEFASIDDARSCFR